MTDGRHIPQEELALYAMQALTPEELERVREHLGGCAACREELASVSGDLAVVAMAVEQKRLPDGARQRFLERIGADEPAAEDTRRTQVVSIAAPKRARGLSLWIPWAAVAALIVLTAVLQTRVRTLDRQVRQQTAELQAQNAENARAQAVLNLLTAKEAQHVVLSGAKSRPAPSARAVYLASKGALMMQASNLEPVPANKTYELWVIPTSGAPIPAGLFRPDAAGNANVVLPELPKGVEAKALGVTIENAGGSSTPTAPIVLEGAPAAGE